MISFLKKSPRSPSDDELWKDNMNLKTPCLEICFPSKKIGYIPLNKSSGKGNTINYNSWHIQKIFLAFLLAINSGNLFIYRILSD